jgi:hypothetical protein
VFPFVPALIFAANREAAGPQGRAERAGARDEPLSERPALAVAISILFFLSPFLLGARGANGKSTGDQFLKRPSDDVSACWRGGRQSASVLLLIFSGYSYR